MTMQRERVRERQKSDSDERTDEPLKFLNNNSETLLLYCTLQTAYPHYSVESLNHLYPHSSQPHPVS